MREIRYAISFALLIIALTAGALVAFDRISAGSLIPAPSASAAVDPDPVDVAPIFAPAGAADYEPFADEDRAWREQNAPPFTLAELRARGDGRRSPRQALEDRVYQHRQRGERAKAIVELERWVAANPRDQGALLSLARLLTEAGRTDAAVARYRQLLAIQQAGRR
jgi:tetratricopeptide (TPR) repeat protein